MAIVGEAGAACARSPVTDQSPRAPEARAVLGQRFDLRVGETAVLQAETLTITFERVAEDSRCPRDTTCVWEGDAAIRLAVRGADAAAGTLTLHTQAAAVREAEFQEYRVRLVQLAPWPQTSGGIPADRYVATLTVSRSR